MAGWLREREEEEENSWTGAHESGQLLETIHHFLENLAVLAQEKIWVGTREVHRF